MEVENIVELCQAYENGFSAGRMNLSSDNNGYHRETDNYYAWMLGHNIGIQIELMELEDTYVN